MNKEDIAPRALTIAGSDSGGGAGIEADLKTFTVFNVYGMAAVTSVTAQNTKTVIAIHNLPPEMVSQQIDAVTEDIGVNAVKTGMLSNEKIIHTVADKIAEYGFKTVVDPVMVTKRGDPLIEEDAVEVYIERMVPKALVITPNITEAHIITGEDINDLDDMRNAAKKIYDFGAESVIIKGGKIDDKVFDLFYDGDGFTKLEGEKYESNKHGTGCTYSSAIAANLAKGISVLNSVKISKQYINEAIREGYKLGKGEHPVNHLVWLGRY